MKYLITIALVFALAFTCAAQTAPEENAPPMNIKSVARIVYDTDPAFSGFAPKFTPRAVVFFQTVPNQRDYVIEVSYIGGIYSPTQQIIHDHSCYACSSPAAWTMMIVDLQSHMVDSVRVYVLDKSTAIQGTALLAK